MVLSRLSRLPLMVLYGVVSLAALLAATKSLLELAKFVSSQHLLETELIEGADTKEEWVAELLIDTLLLFCFVVQHSSMATYCWKKMLENIGVGVIGRALYVICTSLVLMIVIGNWNCTHSVMLWSVDTQSRPLLWFLFMLTHAIGWTLILGSTLLMDAYELLGLKQVYYYVIDLNSPLSLKSSGLRRLYSDMRHPGTVAFTLLLIIHPHMTASRLLLAVVLGLYCATRFSVDKEDYSYMKQNLARKQDEMKMIMEENNRQDNMSIKKVWVKSFSASSYESQSDDE